MEATKAGGMVASVAIHVLIIEDDLDFSALLRRRLMAKQDAEPELAFVVSQTSLLQEAIAFARAHPVDIVVLDLKLPDADGLETIQRVHQATPGAAIVVLTGRDDQKLAASALQMGAQDYLVKGSFNADLLVRVLRYALDRKQSEKALVLAEAALRHAQTVETTAPVDGELIHDFDSLLTNMATQNSQALATLGSDNPARAYIERLNQTINLAYTLTKRLFSNVGDTSAT